VIMFDWLESLLAAISQGATTSKEFDQITRKELNIADLKEVANRLNRIMTSLIK